MAWILVGSVLLVLLIAGLAIDLKDRKRGGNRLARGRALGGSRRDDINQNPSLGSQNSSYIAS